MNGFLRICASLGLSAVACQTGTSQTAPNSAIKQAHEKLVDFKGAGSIPLQGTLTWPQKASRSAVYPAILLLAGSGPTDRDGNQPPNFVTDLLKQIADKLADIGVASFRFDKRSAHVNQSTWPKDAALLPDFFAWPNFTGDVVAAYMAMSTTQGIDTTRCGILGHSEGGLLALATASTLKPKILMLLGTPGRTLQDVITEQLHLQVEKAVASGDLTKEAGQQLLEANARIQAVIVANGQVPTEVPPALAGLYNFSTAKLLHDQLPLDPLPLAKAFSGATLVMNGELDNQVNPQKDSKPLFEALLSRDKTKQELFIVPYASHNLKVVATDREPGFSGPLAPEAAGVLKRWTDYTL